MGRALRSFAAVLVGLALVAMVPTCPCPGKAGAPSSAHRCCAPPTGVSATDHGCCDGHDRTPSDLLTPGPVAAPTAVGLVVAPAVHVVRLDAAPHGSVLTSPSPPPAILRI